MFLDDSDKQDATFRRIEIIGEAVKNIPIEFRKKHAGIPWQTLLEQGINLKKQIKLILKEYKENE